jgi:hypothetical protein
MDRNSSFGSFEELFDDPEAVDGTGVSDAREAVIPCLLPICQVLSESGPKLRAFSKIRWDVVENRCHPKMRPLGYVLSEAIGSQLSCEDAAEIVSVYSTKRGMFEQKRFVKDVINAVLQCSKDNEKAKAFQEQDGQEVAVGGLATVRVNRIVKSFGIFNNIGCRAGVVSCVPEYRQEKVKLKKPRSSKGDTRRCSYSAMDRETVIKKLTDAMKHYNALRLQINVQTFRAIPDMNEADFAREMKRVLELHLDKQDAHTLFDMFDFEGVGVITESQLHEGLAKLHVAQTRSSKVQAKEKALEYIGNADEGTGAVRTQRVHFNDGHSQPSGAASVATGSTKTASISFVASHYDFHPSDFQSAILKLSARYERADPRLNPPLLRVPDGYLLRKFVRRAIKEQLDVKLTAHEIDALCHKLSYTSTDERAALTEDVSENPKLLFVGKTLKALIVRVANVVVKKLPALKNQSSLMGDHTMTISTVEVEDEPSTNIIIPS